MRRARPLLFALTLVAAVPQAGVASPPPMRDARVESSLTRATAPSAVLIRFEHALPRGLTQIPGLTVQYRFASAPAVYARATPAAVRALTRLPGLAAVERDNAIRFDLDTATVASRASDVWGGSDPVAVGGTVVDGRGVGIAIVDTGTDGLHPDFAGRLAGSYQATPAGVVPGGPHNGNLTQDAHGTHVAGIALGSGAQSGGKFRGVAPGASLYSFQLYQGSTAYAAMIFDWILENGATQSPPIRVVNNSWHCSIAACDHAFNPERLHFALASKMAESGITVTWSAGNQQGDGDVSTTNRESINPTPGIISVANYHDENSGRRDLCLSSSSGWGSSIDPTTWPDIAAPGRSITSTWAAGPYSTSAGIRMGRNPVTGADSYYTLTGTSMAAPHVGGIAALMLQANPSLTPAEIEYLLKNTATPLVGTNDVGCGIDYIRADPAHPWTGANYAAGHGLVDARAAVDAALAFTAIPEKPSVEPIPSSFVVSRGGIRADRTLYLTGDDEMSDVYPDADRPTVRVLGPDDSVEHTSAPFTSPLTFDALSLNVYLGSTAEAGDAFSYIGRAFFIGTVEAVRADGSVTRIAEGEKINMSQRTLGPIHRNFRMFLPAPFTLAAGDRVRVRLWAIVFPYQNVEPAVNGVWDVYTESFTNTRLVLGTRVVSPAEGTREACERRRDCAMLDEMHPLQGLACDIQVPFRMRWSGPVGSALIFHCDGITFTCPVLATGVPCDREILVSPSTRDEGAFCTYLLPGGGRGGTGRCESLQPIENV